MLPIENEHHKKETGTYHIRGGYENLIGDDGRHVGAKLTPDHVKQIRRLQGSLTRKQIGVIFGVHATTVQAIHEGRTWKHVPEVRA